MTTKSTVDPEVAELESAMNAHRERKLASADSQIAQWREWADRLDAVLRALPSKMPTTGYLSVLAEDYTEEKVALFYETRRADMVRWLSMALTSATGAVASLQFARQDMIARQRQALSTLQGDT